MAEVMEQLMAVAARARVVAAAAAARGRAAERAATDFGDLEVAVAWVAACQAMTTVVVAVVAAVEATTEE